MDLRTLSESSSDPMRNGINELNGNEANPASMTDADCKLAVSDQDVGLASDCHQETQKSSSDVVDAACAPDIEEFVMAGPPQRKRKARALSEPELLSLADQLVFQVGMGGLEDDKISVTDCANYYGTSIPVFERIFILALSRGLSGYTLDYSGLKQPKPAMTAFIDKRGMLMIGKSTLEAMSNELSGNLKFNGGDSFDVSLRGEEIVLTRS